MARNYAGFVVGLVTALLITTFISHRNAVKGEIARARGWCRQSVAAGLRRALAAVEPVKTDNEEATETLSKEAILGENVSVKEEEDTKVEKGLENSGDDEPRLNNTTTEHEETVDEEMEIVRQTRPLEFRDRLWHEPPEGQHLYRDYDHYEPLEIAQKEFKDAGGEDLEWKTSWLDLYAERLLLHDYLHWTLDVAVNLETAGQKQEWDFYAGLADNLQIELNEVVDEEEVILKRYGKTEEDSRAMERFLLNISLKLLTAEFNTVLGNNRVSIPISERPANWQPGDPAIT